MSEDVDLLPPDEQRAYHLLIRLSAARPAELAAQASMSVEAAARLLESLSVKGLVTAGPVFRPLPPDVALGDLLLRRQQSLESARQLVASLSEEYRASVRRRSAEHLVEVVVGAPALRERLRAMQGAARDEILWFCRANPIAMRGADNHEEARALARGVRYRAIYERALLEMPGELASVVEGVGLGEEARTLPSLPVRLAIVDRSVAICPLVPDTDRGVGEPTAALVRRSELLDALLALFDGYWERATPVVPRDDREAARDEPDRLLLSLLVGGMPDKSIASQLGVSRRTVQRRLERLMSLAGVDTRSGLAFQAGRRGWL